MSIVRYNSNNEIVYHDPELRILVIHDNQENTIRLLDSAGANSHAHGHDVSQSHIIEKFKLPELSCPNCGVNLTDFINKNKRTDFKHHSSLDPRTRTRQSKSANIVELEDLVPSGFMHQDYFKLLANLPFEPNVLAPPNTDALPSEIFNQGYFERFFRKIPPEILGSGAHAQVYKVMHMLKNIQLGIYAVKRINVGDHSQFLDQVLNEVLILYELTTEGANENNLIRYNHVWMEMGDMADLSTIYLSRDGKSGAGDEKIPFVYILQQYCDGGHLENLVADNFQREQFMSAKDRLNMERQRRRNRNREMENDTGLKWLSDFEIWKFFRDIANGVLYLHSKGILHRDLKPSNCLLESKYKLNAELPQSFGSLAEFEAATHKLPKVLVSDFGEGKYIDKQHLADLTLQLDDERRGNTGTIEFTDPKLWIYVHGKHKFAYNFTKASDIYSMGMILCYLCVGELPFSELMTDRTDPEKIRGDIAQWHDHLTPQCFHSWFTAKSLAVKDGLLECTAEFEFLVYQMIKDGTNCEDIMTYLESMKWANFIDHERKHSEATITEVPKGKAELELGAEYEEGQEEDFEEGLLNLTKLNTPDSRKVYSWPSYRRKVAVVSLYMSSLVFLELTEPHMRFLLLVKFLNVLGLSGEVLNEGSTFQDLYGVVCLAFTSYTVHQSRQFELG